MQKKLFLLFILVSILVGNISAAKLEGNDTSYRKILIKIPFDVSEDIFAKSMEQNFYTLELESILRKNESLIISSGMLLNKQIGYSLGWFFPYKDFKLGPGGGYAINFNIGTRFYLSKKDDKKYNMQGFYHGYNIAYTYAKYYLEDKPDKYLNFVNIGTQFGWQKRFNRFNIDIPLGFMVITAYRKSFLNYYDWVMIENINLKISIGWYFSKN